MADFDPTAWRPLGGKSRNYYNPESGKVLSGRQFDKLRGINYEKKAEANKQANIVEALARPAKGRKKAKTQQEKELAVQNYLAKQSAKSASKAKPKKIRPQLLKAGHRAERVSFTTWEQFEDLRQQMLDVKSPARAGFRLITSYAIGVTGFDSRDAGRKEIGAHLTGLQSPRDPVSEEELAGMLEDFIYEHSYFVFSHFFLHLHFDKPYAEGKFAELEKKKAKKNAENIPKYVVEQYHKKAK